MCCHPFISVLSALMAFDFMHRVWISPTQTFLHFAPVCCNAFKPRKNEKSPLSWGPLTFRDIQVDWQVFRSGFNGGEAHTCQTCSILDFSVSVRRRLLLYMSESRFLYFGPSFTSQLHHWLMQTLRRHKPVRFHVWYVRQCNSDQCIPVESATRTQKIKAALSSFQSRISQK